MSLPATKPLETNLSCIYIRVLPKYSHHSHASVRLKEDSPVNVRTQFPLPLEAVLLHLVTSSIMCI